MALGPFDVIGAAASIGFQIAGGIQSYNASQKELQIQQQEIGTEEAMNATRRQGMEVMAGRMQLENVRGAQATAAAARNAAVGKGAQFGSGAAGGQAQINAAAGWNALGTSQNLQLGEQMFNLTDQLDSEKIAMVQQQQKAMQGQALSNIGSLIGKDMNMISNIGGNVWGGGGDMSKGFWNMFS